MRDAYVRELPLLRFIASPGSTRAQIKALLPRLTRNQLNFIGEIAYNILKAVIPLTREDKESLRHYFKQIRAIGQKKKKSHSIRQALTVGGLLALVKVSLSSVEEVIGDESHG